MSSSYTLYDLNTFDNITDVVLQHPQEIHDKLVKTIENILGEKGSREDVNSFRDQFKKKTNFPSGYVNSSRIINAHELYTHTMYLCDLSEDKISRLNSEIIINYLPEAQRFKTLHSDLFIEDYPDMYS